MNSFLKTFKRMPENDLLFLVDRTIRKLKPIYDYTASVDFNLQINCYSVKNNFDALMEATLKLRYDLPNLLYEESYGKSARLCCDSLNSLFYNAAFFAALIKYDQLPEEQKTDGINIIVSNYLYQIYRKYKNDVSDLCYRITKSRDFVNKRKWYNFYKPSQRNNFEFNKEFADV